MSKNEYSGYGLFNDVEDTVVRDYNRGRTIVNILEDNSDGKGNITPRGAQLAAGYLLAIPDVERSSAYKQSETILKQKGMINVGN